MPELLDTIEELSDQLQRLNDELRVIREVMDEIREQLTWGLQNGRVVLSLAELDDQRKQAAIELEGQPIELVLQLQTSLTKFANEIADTVKNQIEPKFASDDSDPDPTAETITQERNQNDPPASPKQSQKRLPEVTLFEAGELVEMVYESPGQQAEIISVDDARNSALIELIDPKVQKLVSQDAIRKVTPQIKEQAEESHELQIHDIVQFELDGTHWQGEIVTLTADSEAIISLPEQSDYVHIPLDHLAKVNPPELSKHDRWCLQVRDIANQNNEGRRKVTSSDGKAFFEYTIAELSKTRWAVSWNMGYRCGDHLGSAIPWRECESRNECLQTMLAAVKEFFLQSREDKHQTRVRLEMLDRIGSGLFGFREPEPVPDQNRSQKLFKTH